MNAIVALCHFCEAHGPAAIFCTQTLRNTRISELNFEDQQIANSLCAACNSLGKSTGVISTDDTTNANFLSCQIPVLPEVAILVKQASVRSLSCEINSNKDGGFVFFGDSSRGHILSHTFHVSDLQARGFYQLFSIIVLMKDKFFLLNIQPFLAEHIKKISGEIKDMAEKIHTQEQSKYSGRDCRLTGNGPIIPSTPRSLADLTGEPNIFPILHSHFTWLLLAGAKYLTEHTTFVNLPWLMSENALNRKTVDFRNQSELCENFKNELVLDKDNSDEMLQLYSLRTMKEILQDGFAGACFCILSGLKVIIRGPPDKTNILIMCMKKLLPQQMQSVIQTDKKFLENSECRIIAITPDIAVPMPNSEIYRIDFTGTEQNVSIKWLGSLPSKNPDLLSKILKAVHEPLFNNLVLDRHLTVLIEEWKNKINCIKKIKSTTDRMKLRRILGIQAQDDVIVNYWSKYLQRY